jgi:hypothetical protein
LLVCVYCTIDETRGSEEELASGWSALREGACVDEVFGFERRGLRKMAADLL